jgi:hypothetical protein
LKRRIATFTVLLTIIILFGIISIEEVSANPFGADFPKIPIPTIIIQSPIENQSYSPRGIQLQMSIVKPSDWSPLKGRIYSVTYFINGTVKNGAIELQDTSTLNSLITYNVSVNLPELSKGSHLLEVYLSGKYEDTTFSALTQRTFTVQSEDSQTPIMLGLIGIIALVTVCSLMYFKRRKKLTSKQSFL